MSEPVDVELSPDTDPGPGAGHSRAAHRVHGWCALCAGYGYAREALAWRVRENRREEATRAALDASGSNPSTVDLTSAPERPCPSCGRETMTVVQAVSTFDGRVRTIGGWAECSNCGATPHPTMPDVQEDTDHG
ncbi:hypothetical protein OG234_13230 [Streptomyces sp. NBC_01420]|uniref:hypothetical protein n=1 Tax=Streptomyces sp. NBC_01420 TaxID=2903858 RepID=UPI003244A76A